MWSEGRAKLFIPPRSFPVQAKGAPSSAASAGRGRAARSGKWGSRAAWEAPLLEQTFLTVTV